MVVIGTWSKFLLPGHESQWYIFWVLPDFDRGATGIHFGAIVIHHVY